MNLQYRLDLLVRLADYMLSSAPAWVAAKEKAAYSNGWFIPQFIDSAVAGIANNYLQKLALEKWLHAYTVEEPRHTKTVGIVMAGNIPLVGFHDLLCVFVSGHKALIKASSKDDILIRHLTDILITWDNQLADRIEYAVMLKGCDAYIATGSNNSSLHFEFYFSKYPHIIRRNRSSIAVLTGNENEKELEALAEDVHLYFGLGCRNVTKLYVPADYDFIPLLQGFRKYSWLSDHHKYKNNYDYNLAIYILNKKYYMTNGSILLIEDHSIFSPISQLNYEFYKSAEDLKQKWPAPGDIQCTVGQEFSPFGQAQSPALADYADGVDTLNFLLRL